MTETTKKSKCLGCGKLRGHVAGCRFIPCSKCGIAADLGHLPECPDYIGTTPTPEEEHRQTRTTVDGREAEVHHHEPADGDGEDDDFIDGRAFPPIALIEGAVESFQRSINSAEFSGEKQLKEKCDFEMLVDGEPMKCPHIAAFTQMIKEKCPTCEHAHKETVAKFCVGHAINVFGGGAPAKLQTEMQFGETAA